MNLNLPTGKNASARAAWTYEELAERYGQRFAELVRRTDAAIARCEMHGGHVASDVPVVRPWLHATQKGLIECKRCGLPF